MLASKEGLLCLELLALGRAPCFPQSLQLFVPGERHPVQVDALHPFELRGDAPESVLVHGVTPRRRERDACTGCTIDEGSFVFRS